MRASAVAMVGLWMLSCAAPPRPELRLEPPPSPAPQPISFSTTSWPRREVLDLALHAYRCGRNLGDIDRPLLTVIDYSLPSTARRLWVIDVAHSQVLFNELVAHGQRSGEDSPVAFSNRLGSRQSSLGLFRTDEVFTGEHGLSLRLSGLEPGVNDRARERHIIMHGADYVSEVFIAEHGRLGRSWGCPALPAEVHERVIDRIRDGSAVFAYYPDPQWLESSRFLHCDKQAVRGYGTQQLRRIT